VDEDLIGDVLVKAASYLNNVSQSYTGSVIVLLLCINDVDETTTVFNSLNIVCICLLELLIPWEVLNSELNEGIIVNLEAFNFSSLGQEKCFVGRHLLEDDSLDTCLTRFWLT